MLHPNSLLPQLLLPMIANIKKLLNFFTLSKDSTIFLSKKSSSRIFSKPVFFMESTGVYHLTLFHFLKDNKFETFVINPLVTNSNKNKDIRKVKNDTLSIAKLGRFEDIRVSSDSDINISILKLLVRDYYKLIDTKSNFKKKLSVLCAYLLVDIKKFSLTLVDMF